LLFSASPGTSVGRLRVSEFLLKSSHEGHLFRMFPLSLQTITSNQMRPQMLRGAWFSRLLRHPARKRSESILSPGIQTGLKASKCIFVQLLCRNINSAANHVRVRIFETTNKGCIPFDQVCDSFLWVCDKSATSWRHSESRFCLSGLVRHVTRRQSCSWFPTSVRQAELG